MLKTFNEKILQLIVERQVNLWYIEYQAQNTLTPEQYKALTQARLWVIRIMALTFALIGNMVSNNIVRI